MSNEHCFLCAKTRHIEDPQFERIVTGTVPASQKTIQLVLQHLANCIKIKLVFETEACVCSGCFKELAEYDLLMLNLLSFQKRLTHQLEAILTSKLVVEEDDMENVSMVIEEEHLSDVSNSEIDTKEELIDVDDNMIEDEISDESDDDKSDEEIGRRRRKQECVACGESFKSKVQLQIHISEMHNIKAYNCNICGIMRKDEEYLELHMNVHEGKTENECRYCAKKFSRPVNTLRHMRKHWDKKKYQCEKCGERFSLDNMLYNHRLRHEAEENPLICSNCNQSFKSRKTFNHHMLIHQKDRPRHHCTLCSKSFTERYTLKMHMKTHGHTNKLADQPQSEEYKEIDAAVTTLIVEGEAKELCCVICNTKFESKELLEKHLQNDHDVIIK